ncbi:MAG: GNAT family N-acetyltransferase [Nocardioides sp.]
MHSAPVPLDDDAALRAWHAAGLASHVHDRPDAPFWTEDEAVLIVSSDDPEERALPFAVHDDDGATAAGGVVFVPLLDNHDKAYAAMNVHPDHRGRGAGDAAVEHMVAATRAEDRHLLIVTAWFPADSDDTHPVRAFAARHGFELANTEVRRVLELPLPLARIRAWVQEAAEHHDGYEIQCFGDDVPEHLQPSLVDLHNQLAVDAPTGDIDFEAGQMTVETLRHQVRQRRATGREVLTALAVKDGTTVAHSTLSIPPRGEMLPHVNQWGTYVDRAHRGRRLGLATKAANLLRLQELYPDRTLVGTTNSPVNGPMVGINERMGFRQVEIMGEFTRRV